MELKAIHAHSQPWLDGMTRGELRLLRCATCGHAQSLAPLACAVCHGRDLQWTDSLGRGTVRAASVVHRAPSDAYRPLVPYTLAMVQLDEGPRVMAHLAPGLPLGARVRATFFEHDGRTLVRFISD